MGCFGWVDSVGSGIFPVNSSDCSGIDDRRVRISSLSNDATGKRSIKISCFVNHEGSSNDVILTTEVLNKLFL